MKVCKYCNSECDDTEKVCHSCGASEFSNKCRNCGTVFDSGFCPNCGYNGSVQNAHQTTTAFQTSPAANSFNNNRNNKSKTSIGTILLWIFFLPVMVIVTIWKSEKLDKKWKIILTVIILAFYLVAGAVNNDTTSTTAFIAGLGF